MKFIAKFGTFSIFLILFVLLAWFALFFFTPMASSQEIANDWTWWLRGVAYNWEIVLGGCLLLAAIGAVVEIQEDKEKEKERDGR